MLDVAAADPVVQVNFREVAHGNGYLHNIAQDLRLDGRL